MFDTLQWEPVSGPVTDPRRVLPDGLTELAPGPELARVLEEVDRTELNGYELVSLLKARAGQVAHLQAELYADIWEMAFSAPLDAGEHHEPIRTPDIDPYATDELRCALSLTRRSADIQLSLAYDLMDRLPQVWKALLEGRIDLPRARVICSGVAHLESEEAGRIVDSIIAQVDELTAGQIADRLRRRCMQIVPDNARRRYEDGVAGRRVEAFSNEDGTFDLVGRQLPVDRAAAIMRRVNRIAGRLHGKDDRTVDQLRADVLMDLLEGREFDDTTRRTEVEIRVDLPTLLGLAENPGEIPGWGPVIADVARRLVEGGRDGEWCVVVTDPDSGVPVHTQVTRRRPSAAQQRHVRARNPVCIFPGCRAPASQSHLDHTIDRAKGGVTATENLAPACPHDHLTVKHKAGWKLRKIVPGTYEWTSPRGHVYVVRPPPG